VTNHDTSVNSQTTSWMLTLPGLRGFLLDGCELAFERGQLFLEVLLGLSSTCSDSRSKSHNQDLAKELGVGPEQRREHNLYNGLEVGGRVLRLPLGVLQLLLQVVRVLARLARHGFLDALDLTRAATSACSFISRAAAASACAFAASRSRPVRACARSARDYT
jgi:hypothetical protein